MNLPPFPDNMPRDELGAIIDQNMLSDAPREFIESIEGQPYATTTFLKHCDKDITHLFTRFARGAYNHHFRGHSHKPSADRYNWCYEYLTKVAKQSKDRDRALILVTFCRQFYCGAGAMVDTENQDDIVAQRMKVYQRHFTPLKQLCPKYFLAQKVGELSASLPDRDLEGIHKEYEQVICRHDPQGRIPKDYRDYLRRGVSIFAQKSFRSLGSRTFDEDVKLIALAYSIPATKVDLYSNDNDLAHLVLIGNCLVPRENVVRVRIYGFRNSLLQHLQGGKW